MFKRIRDGCGGFVKLWWEKLPWISEVVPMKKLKEG
ncbi:hypothetical protein CK203_004471 [Vitis vinifera]|uniref:Uncharacterized protein n=1 Tax=Vitis vinifera TaxID=29760 RepID=A0A438KGS7_VITVI|nr:hypothetical protein CK203_004471 [Vitis vinifera]